MSLAFVIHPEYDFPVCCMCICTADKEDDAEPLFSGKNMFASTTSDEDEEEEEGSEELAAAVKAMPPLEGTKKAAAVSKRSPNFGINEDKFITKAWCLATEDSKEGNGQKQQGFF
jgi:hypothetical protein